MFIEAQFPQDLSYGSSGGPSYKTTLTETRSGVETRNADWASPRRKFNAAYNVRTLQQLDILLSWFHVCNGRANGFRFKDWTDYRSGPLANSPTSTDVAIGNGTGSKTVFQLYKTRSVGGQLKTMTVYKPVFGTVLIAVNGVQKTETTHYTVNYTNGAVTFITAPPNGQPVTAGFEYDVPVRFDTDDLSDLNAIDFNVFAANVPLIEIRDIA